MDKSVQQQSGEDNQADHHDIHHQISVRIALAVKPAEQMFTHGRNAFHVIFGSADCSTGRLKGFQTASTQTRVAILKSFRCCGEHGKIAP